MPPCDIDGSHAMFMVAAVPLVEGACPRHRHHVVATELVVLGQLSGALLLLPGGY